MAGKTCRRVKSISKLALAVISVCRLFDETASGADTQYVIQISVDGLGSPYLQALMAGKQLPNFQRIQAEGAWTLNARCDYDYSVTLPNHTTVVTGRGVVGTAGHNWTVNVDPAPGVTIQSNKGSYVASVYDVAHDNSLSTALYAGKSKFSLIDTSYNATNGAMDTVGVDNGRDKIDTYVYNSTPDTLVSSFLSGMSANHFNYTLLHLGNPDFAGSWGSTGYNNAIKTVDGYLGSILNMVETDPLLKGKTTVIVSADHGGSNNSHSTATAPVNYTIPFMVWGPNASANVDLYGLNSGLRQDPGTAQVNYSAAMQPIRHADGTNLALELLGLNAIPGSTINAAQDLKIQGSTPKPPVVIAYNAFNETPIGVSAWHPGTGDTEMGFTTRVIAAGLSPNPVLGSYDSTSSPRRLRMLGCAAEVTFDSVDLTGYTNRTASIDILIKNTTYESDDFYKVILTNGLDTITLANVQGSALNSLAKAEFISYSALIPDSWDSVQFVLSSHTNSSADAEAVDFDHLFVTGTSVPEPSGMLLFALAGINLARRRRRA